MAGTFGLISGFNHEVQDWNTYKNRLTQWFIANDINDESDKAGVKRRAILLSALAESTYRLASNLALPSALEQKNFSDVVKILDDHFTPKRCAYVERFHFYSAAQQVGEGHAQWAARLKGLAAHCQFNNMDDSLLDRFLMGMLPGPEREKLFAQSVGELTLSKAIDLAESVRCARAGAAAGGVAAPAPEPGALFQIEKTAASTPGSTTSVKCSVCGRYNHSAAKCRFRYYKCKKCHTKGHLSNMCKNVKFIETGEMSEGDDGVFGVLLNIWLYVTFIHSHLLIYRSHILVLNLCLASLGRNLLGFPFAASSAIAQRWLFGSACCQLFAFLNQFFGVFQMTALLAVILERYLLAKFYRRERILHLRLYWILVGTCFLNSLVFAMPPLFGYGVYSCDPSGTACSFSWPMMTSGAKQLVYTVPYVLICGVVPVVTIFCYIGKAIRLETIYYRSEEQKEQKRLTKSIHALTIATLALWVPSAVLAGWQWFPSFLLSYRPHVPPALALIAPIASEAATSVPVLCYLGADERLRAALLGRIRKHYALLRPDRAKRFQATIYSYKRAES